MLGRSLLLKASGSILTIPWTPAAIATALWLDAADASTITTSGSDVTQVNDKSGNSRNFTSASGARPSTGGTTLNGKNVLTFDADYLTSSSAASTWNFLHQSGGSEVIGVWKAGNVSDPNTLYAFWGNNAGTVLNQGIYSRWDDRAANGFNDALVAAAGALFDPIIDVSANNVHAANTATILGTSLNLNSATAANRMRHVVNGTVLAGNNTNTSNPLTGSASFALQIGAAGNNIWPLTGYIAEFIVSASQLSTANRQLIEGYLAHKWGLAANLPNDHPYKNAAPTIQS
jgi:hypothetical protein